MRLGVFSIEHRINHRRNRSQNCRAIPLDYFKHLFRRRAFSKERRGAAQRKWEQQICARSVTEEEFGNGNSEIVFVDAHRAPGKDLSVIRQVVLQAYSALRLARRSGSKEPDRDVVAMR